MAASVERAAEDAKGAGRDRLPGRPHVRRQPDGFPAVTFTDPREAVDEAVPVLHAADLKDLLRGGGKRKPPEQRRQHHDAEQNRKRFLHLYFHKNILLLIFK